MKITQLDLGELIGLVREGAARIPSPAKYEARDPSIRRIDLAADTAKRYRWDAMWAADGQKVRDWTLRVYEYANDSHIDTALKAAVAAIQQTPEIKTLGPALQDSDAHTPSNLVKVGEVYAVDHSRKGKFLMKVTAVNGEWIEGVVVEGRALLLSRRGSVEAGESLTIRDSLATFSQVQ